MYRNTIADQAYHLLIEGKTPAEVRTSLKIELHQWNELLKSKKILKLYEFGLASSSELISTIEAELWQALGEWEHYKANRWKVLHWKQKQDLSTRINNLKTRYATFCLPKKD